MTEREEHDPVPESDIRSLGLDDSDQEVVDSLVGEEWTLREGRGLSDASRRRAHRLARALIPGYAARERDAAAREAEWARAEAASRACGCSSPPPRHRLRVWLRGRTSPIAVHMELDAGHAAKLDLEDAMQRFVYRSEFIFPPVVSFTSFVGKHITVSTPDIQAVELSDVSPREIEALTKRVRRPSLR